MKSRFDVAVLGSGFAGSLMAMIAQRLGKSVVLIERAKHPRFAIGESSTPLANLLLEELAAKYDLPGVASFSKWGTWQRDHPEVAGGLKRGFTFCHHFLDEPFQPDESHRNELLVAASPNAEIADTHWHRAEIDHWFAKQAQDCGVEFLEETSLSEVRFSAGGAGLTLKAGEKMIDLTATFVLDATGPRGALVRALELPEAPFEKLPGTQGLYSHFKGVRRWDELFPPTERPPYPPDDAALHHVFPGGWIWVLRFNNGITSAGAAVTDSLASELQLQDGAPAWDRLLRHLPSIHEQFESVQAVLPFQVQPRLSFLSGYVTGPQWALLPSAAGFVDPLLSTGFPLTLLGVMRMAELIEQHWGAADWRDQLFEYSVQTTTELVLVSRLVAALYATMDDFELFSALTLLYFAAATFTETARRLGKPELAGKSFLLADNPLFGLRARYCIDRVLQSRQELSHSPAREIFLDRIRETIEPIDVAGLSARGRRNWFPVNADDLRNNRQKVGATAEEIEDLLRRVGF